MSCKECGKELVKWLRSHNINLDTPIFKLNLQEIPSAPMDVRIPMRTMKEFSKSHAELMEFSAYVCGVKPQEFTLAHMISHIREVESLKKEIDSIHRERRLDIKLDYPGQDGL